MKRRNRLRDIRRIVVLRTDRIGEVLLSVPVIEALHKRFPEAEIDFVTSAYSADIIKQRPDIARIILFDTFSAKTPLWSAFRLANKLRPKAFDMAVVLNPHKVLHLACFLSNIPVRAGFNRKWPFLLTHRAEDNRDKAMMHEVEYNLRFLRIIDIYTDNTAPSMPVSGRDSSFIKEALRKAGITDKDKIVALHPGSSSAKKIWPVENFKKIAKSLSEANAAFIVIIGDEHEKPLGRKIALSLRSNVFDMTGFFTLKQLAALLKRAELFITNDNGPMHISAAVGTKTIALFNKDSQGSSPKRWSPYGEGHIVFHKPLNQISPEEVARAALDALK